jgi:hypothetical protein
MPSRNTVEIVIQAKDEASKQVDSIFSGIVGQTAKIGLAMQGLKTIIDSTVGSLSDMAREAATSMNVEAAFAGVVEKSGKSMNEMLAALEKGSSGMVDQTSLMKSYNTAAQLVGTTFANQLPDAMAYLGKVSAATGQDMGFMLDSLVRGVGRLSPMILDNLGIQVDVVAANEAYAASIGKTVEELTKEEQQTALMNQVMQKLGENTAAMPDIADSAAAKFARFDAKMKNLKDTIGRAALPAFEKLTDVFMGFMGAVNVLLTGKFSKDFSNLFGGIDEDHPIFVFFWELRNAIQAVSSGVPIFDALWQMLSEIQDAASDYGIGFLVDGLQVLMDLISQILKPVGDWISKNIELKDVLIGLGLIAASIVVPALIGIGSAILGILLPIAAVIGAVALVRQIWETDFGGIRTFITEQLLPALGRLWSWFTTEGLPAIRQILLDVYNNVFLPVFNWLGDVWETTVKPGLEAMWTWFTTEGWPAIKKAVEDLKLAFEELIKKVGEFVSKNPELVVAMGIAIAIMVALKAQALATAGAQGIGAVLSGLAQMVINAGSATLHLGALVLQFGLLTAGIYLAIRAFQQLQPYMEAYNKSTELANQKVASGEMTRSQVGNIRQNAIQSQVQAEKEKGNWLSAAMLQGLGNLGAFGSTSGVSTSDMLDFAHRASAEGWSQEEMQRQMDIMRGVSRQLGGTALPGVPYRTHAGETFIPNQPGRFEPNSSGGSNITINFGGGPTSETEAQEYGRIITDAMQMLGAPA